MFLFVFLKYRVLQFLELMQYHSPISESYIRDKKVNDIGGVGHICLRVNDIDNAFTFIKNNQMLNWSVSVMNTSHLKLTL